MIQAAAQHFCQSTSGTDLATVDTESKSESMKEILSEQHADKAWIGLMKQNGSWEWIDGTPCSSYLEPGIDCSQDPEWAPDEPNPLPKEYCATVGDHHGGSYNNIDCDQIKFVSFCNYHPNFTIIVNDNSSDIKVIASSNVPENNKNKYLDDVWIVVIVIVVIMIFVMIFIWICMHRESKEEEGEQRKDENDLTEVSADNGDEDNETVSSVNVILISPDSPVHNALTEDTMQQLQGGGIPVLLGEVSAVLKWHSRPRLAPDNSNTGTITTVTNGSSTVTQGSYKHDHIDSEDHRID